MQCPFCDQNSTKVIDSRTADGGNAIRRRRECNSCNGRFTTLESAQLLVTKRDGTLEAFKRDKVVQGVRRACQGRDVPEDALKRLAQQVEKAFRRAGTSQIPTNAIGLAILEPLRELDEVAYLRFASVYKSFESTEDFESEIRMMRRLDREVYGE
ncbi:MAG: transcriptional regulator NrdR [Corynebacterium sp.]|nr:transcriptional regulator NrdR [Corynebacterium sp.]